VLDLQTRIQAFEKLGEYLKNFSSDELQHLKSLAKSKNNWFTSESIDKALEGIQTYLDKTDLEKWVAQYPKIAEVIPKKVAIVMAGNIPAVGFHDFLSVLMSGHKVLARPSSEDEAIMRKIGQILIQIEPQFADYIEFVEKINAADAIIATGSDNTARYFEYYFKDKPNIIRKNRNSVAVLTGDETKEDLVNLGEDIFRYFGLGCRNVSKVLVPKDYDFKNFFEAIYEYKDVIFYEKYSNNYDYNKAVFLMSNFKLLDNEFLTLKEDSSYASPISSVFYEYYEDIEVLKTQLKNDADQIQCIVSNGIVENSIPFGKTQKPELWDYADNVDTIQFLIQL